MATKADWKAALQEVAQYGLGIETLTYNGKLSGLKDKEPHTLTDELAQQINGLRDLAEAELQKRRSSQVQDLKFEIEDLEYQNRILKALVYLAYGNNPETIRRVQIREEVREALEATKDYEAEIYDQPDTNTATVTFLHKDEYKSPMEGIGWHTFNKPEEAD